MIKLDDKYKKRLSLAALLMAVILLCGFVPATTTSAATAAFKGAEAPATEENSPPTNWAELVALSPMTPRPDSFVQDTSAQEELYLLPLEGNNLVLDQDGNVVMKSRHKLQILRDTVSGRPQAITKMRVISVEWNESEKELGYSSEYKHIKQTSLFDPSGNLLRGWTSDYEYIAGTGDYIMTTNDWEWGEYNDLVPVPEKLFNLKTLQTEPLRDTSPKPDRPEDFDIIAKGGDREADNQFSISFFSDDYTLDSNGKYTHLIFDDFCLPESTLRGETDFLFVSGLKLSRAKDPDNKYSATVAKIDIYGNILQEFSHPDDAYIQSVVIEETLPQIFLISILSRDESGTSHIELVVDKNFAPAPDPEAALRSHTRKNTDYSWSSTQYISPQTKGCRYFTCVRISVPYTGITRYNIYSEGHLVMQNLTQVYDMSSDRLVVVSGFKAGLMDYDGNWLYVTSAFSTPNDDTPY